MPKLYEARIDRLVEAYNPPEKIPRSLNEVVRTLEREGLHRNTLRKHIKDDLLAAEDVSEISKLFHLPEELFASDYFIRERGKKFVFLGDEFMAAVRAHWRPTIVVSDLSDEQVERAFREDQPAYGGENISREKFWEWHLAYPRGFMIALKDGDLIAGMGFFPVTATWARRFYEGDCDEADLSEETIRTSNWTAWYLSGLAARFNTLNAGAEARMIIGRFLLNWIINNSDRIGTKEITIVAEGTTDQGARLLEQFFTDINKSRKTPNGARRALPHARYRWPGASLAKIKNLLVNDSFFRECHELRRLMFDAQYRIGVVDGLNE